MTALGGIAAALLGGLGSNQLGTSVQNFQVTTGGTLAYNPAQTWASWNNNYWYVAMGGTASTAGNETVWQNWCNTPTNVAVAVEPSVEQIRAYRKTLEEAEAAQAKAEALLLEHLDPAQRESYRANKLFIVETPKKNRYQLSHHTSPVKIDKGKAVTSYCIHTRGVPRADELLGFKLLLEANEDLFLSTANATRLAA